jgi:hypothetical protein
MYSRKESSSRSLLINFSDRLHGGKDLRVTHQGSSTARGAVGKSSASPWQRHIGQDGKVAFRREVK